MPVSLAAPAPLPAARGPSGPWSNGRTPVFGTGGGGSTPPGPIRRLSAAPALLLGLWAAAAPVAAFGSPLAVAPYLRGHGSSAARPGASAVLLQAGATEQERKDSTAARSRAHSLQARFERTAIRHLPFTLGGTPECDEIVGRLCIWDGGGDRAPKPEAEEVAAARERLLDELAEVAGEIPGDGWVFGQRILYLVDAGRLAEAASLARRCQLAESWRCAAYLGYVLHRDSDVVGAEEAFGRAMAEMPASMRTEWRDPGPLLDGDLRGWLKDQPDSAAAVEKLWALSDPLYLVEGNDRRTAHYSRWVYSMGQADARNPHAMPWGDDMTEVAVRFGWSAGCERLWPESTIHPRRPRVWCYDYLDYPGVSRATPPRSVLERPQGGDERVWEHRAGLPQSVHLPPYLDSLEELTAQVGRLSRPGGVILLAAWRTPDLSLPRTMQTNGGATGGAVAAGLFAVQGGAVVLDERTAVASGGAVRVAGRVPHSEWGVVSVESWAPEDRRAWRLRQGMSFSGVPRDVFALSDLLLIEPESDPGNTDELLGALQPTTVAGGDAAVGVAFEIYGLRPVGETVHYRAWVEARSEGLLTRFGRWLGIGRREKVSVSWREVVPQGTGTLLRSFSIRLPGLGQGAYQIVIEVFVEGREPLQTRLPFTVEPGL